MMRVRYRNCRLQSVSALGLQIAQGNSFEDRRRLALRRHRDPREIDGFVQWPLGFAATSPARRAINPCVAAGIVPYLFFQREDASRSSQRRYSGFLGRACGRPKRGAHTEFVQVRLSRVQAVVRIESDNGRGLDWSWHGFGSGARGGRFALIVLRPARAGPPPQDGGPRHRCRPENPPQGFEKLESAPGNSLAPEDPRENRVDVLQVIAKVEQRLEFGRRQRLRHVPVRLEQRQKIALAAPHRHGVALDQ